MLHQFVIVILHVKYNNVFCHKGISITSTNTKPLGVFFGVVECVLKGKKENHEQKMFDHLFVFYEQY